MFWGTPDNRDNFSQWSIDPIKLKKPEAYGRKILECLKEVKHKFIKNNSFFKLRIFINKTNSRL